MGNNIINKINGTVGIGTNNSEKFNLQVYGSKGITHTGPNLSLATIDSNAYTSSLYYNAFAGDTNIYSFWGVSINLNNGGVNPNGNTANARIPNTSSFTINQKSIGGTATSGFTTLFTVSQNGNVGIGTTNNVSGNILDVRGGIFTTNGITISDNTTLSGNDVFVLGNYELFMQPPTASSDAIIQTIRQGYNYNQNLTLQANGGNVGIGITSPNTRLHVNSGTSSTGAISGYYFSNSTTITSNTIGDNTVCAQFESSVWSKTKFICSSDERIKKNIVDIDDDNALQKILNIKPKTYQYIDTVERGNDIVYGFIAQQIQEIIPEAVTVTKEIIPNIYICECSNNIITLPDNIISSNILNINDEIIIIDEINYERKSYIIQDIDNNKITIDNNLIGSNCFVYGTKVNDFHTLNKDYIFTLNVCATQDLYKIIQEQQKQINYLLSKINI